MPKSRQRTIVIAANPAAVVAKKSLYFLTSPAPYGVGGKSKAMNTNNQMQKDPACCEPGSVCCGIDGTGIVCC